jgi:hypothetical protein
MTHNICDQKPMNCDCTSLEKSQREEIETLQLTDEEREAIEGVIVAEHERGAWRWADTLRNLLERLK